MKRILIVDDSDQNLYYLRALLTGHGFDVECAFQGAKALDKARLRAPDLVVSDLLMPVMDGYTLLREWKTDENLRNIPFVVYTATYTDPQDERLALDMGADTFVSKGIEPEEFLDRIHAAIQGAAAGQTALPAQQTGSEYRVLKQYSEVLMHKLEEKTLELEELNRSLQAEVLERSRLATTQTSILNALPAHIALIDREGAILAVNESWRRFAQSDFQSRLDLGIGSNYLASCLTAQGVCFESSNEAVTGIQRVLRGEASEFVLEYCCHTAAKQGSFRIIATPLASAPGAGAVIMHIDITEAKLIEMELRASQEQALLLLNSTAEGIYGLDMERRCKFCNPSAARLLRCGEPDTLVGQFVHELHHHSKNSATPEPMSMCNICRAFQFGEKSHTDKAEFFRADGTPMPVEYWSYPIRNDSGIIGAVVTFLDITERRNLEAQLLQAQKMEAIGRLSGGIAHDFNNLLTVILGCSDLIATELAGNPRLRSAAEMIQAAAQRGAALTHQMLAVGRRQTLQPKTVNVKTLLASMQPLLRSTIRADIRIEFVPDAKLWTALVDPLQLEGAVLNLSLNARDAMPKGGELTIETSNQWLDSTYAEHDSEVISGEYVMIVVSDTGTGIPHEDLSRIFEPFFTTKDIGKGTGLGLSMVYGFAKQSQGNVRVYLELEFGTCIKLYLPRAGGREETSEPVPELNSEIDGTEKILLVEDDPLVLRFAEAQLAGLGYKTVAVTNGSDALEGMRRNPDFDLLLTDIVMPGGIGGRQLTEEAQRICPALELLFVSGYTDREVFRQNRPGNEDRFLTKPYSRLQLARKLRSILSRGKR